MWIRFLAVVLGAVALLTGLNWLPACLGGEPRGVVRYPTLAALEARYRVRLTAPGGSPIDGVRLAVDDPGWLTFAVHPHGAAPARPLIVCQTLQPVADAPDLQVPAALLPTGERLQAIQVSAARRTGELRRILLADGQLVHELWWREGGRRVMLRGDQDAGRLLRVFDEVARQQP